MAEEQDRSDKTEEATPRRLEEAREKGQVAQSREVASALLLGTLTLVVMLQAPIGLDGLLAALARYLADADRLQPGLDGLWPGLAAPLASLLWWLGPLLAGLIAAALLAAWLQNAVVWTVEPLKPKLERISPLAGLKRLFSSRALFELAKSMLKFMLVGGVSLAILWSSRELLLAPIPIPDHLVGALGRTSVLLLGALALVVAVIGGADLAFQRHRHAVDLRMSRRDIRDELRQQEGDPLVRQRLRNLRLQRMRRRMIAEVPKATVIVTNPAHYAVALRWAEGMAAPVVVAKGVDRVALRIREVAAAHRVPIVADPPLARTLHASVELGEPIPPDHYRAVAEIIGFVLRKARAGL